MTTNNLKGVVRGATIIKNAEPVVRALSRKRGQHQESGWHVKNGQREEKNSQKGEPQANVRSVCIIARTNGKSVGVVTPVGRTSARTENVECRIADR